VTGPLSPVSESPPKVLSLKGIALLTSY